MKFGIWDAAEDEILKQQFKATPKKWARIADHIDGRTGTQVAERWQLLEQQKNGKMGRWSKEEDEELGKL